MGTAAGLIGVGSLVLLALVAYKYRQKSREWRAIRTEAVQMSNYITQLQSQLLQTEQSLTQSEERYQSLVELSPEAIVVFTGLKLVYANRAALAIFRAQSIHQLQGSTIHSLIHSTDRATILQKLRRSLPRPPVIGTCEVQATRLDGTVMELEVTGVGIRYEGRPAVQFMFRDVTERKRTAELLQRARTQAIVGEIAAGIAHEIRNPLTVVRGFVQLLDANDSPHRHYYRLMLEETDRINRSVSELLRFAKPQAAIIAEIDLRTLLDGLEEMFEAQATLNNVTLHSQRCACNPLVRGDENQLKQAFANILQNAIDAMPHGGMVWVRMLPVVDDVVRVEIADSGPGIDASRIPLLGEPYFTTNEKGIGLGLMISYEIIHRYGGTIGIDSQPGMGTVVTVTLPVVAGSTNTPALADIQ